MLHQEAPTKARVAGAPLCKGGLGGFSYAALGAKTLKDNYRYEIIIYWSDEDQAFIAEVPELSGCASDGASYQEALSNAQVVIQEWIETATELGRTIPTPRGRLMFA